MKSTMAWPMFKFVHCAATPMLQKQPSTATSLTIMGALKVHVTIMNKNTNRVSANIENVSKNTFLLNIVHFINTCGEGNKSRQKVTMCQT